MATGYVITTYEKPKKDESKPWKGICVKNCWFAKHDKCKCRCKKQNHGKGFQKNPDKKEEKQ